MEALAEAIIAAVPGEEADTVPSAGVAARVGGANDANHEHERLQVKHSSARCPRV